MKITVKRSGGFSGISMPAKTIDTDDAETVALAEQILGFTMCDDGKTTDGMQYDITFDDGEHTSNRTFYDPINSVVESLVRKVL